MLGASLDKNEITIDPSISVVICTRNRGDSVLLAIESLLANTHPNFEIIIVDQSDKDDTEIAIRPLCQEPRLRYIRSATQGLGRARNIGLANARADYVIMTDDDCEAPSDWVEKMARRFAERPNIAAIFCTVEAAPYDRCAGFTPIFACQKDKLLTSVRDRCAPHAIGAGMAVRKSAILELGGFDEMLGAGARFPSFEDADIVLRALLKGYQVYQTSEVSVLHHGFRDWSRVRQLIRTDFVGIGAGHAKLLKCGQWRVLSVCAYDVWRLILEPFCWHVLRLKKPPVFRRALCLSSGFIKGLRAPVDRKKLVFHPTDRTSPAGAETNSAEMSCANR